MSTRSVSTLREAERATVTDAPPTALAPSLRLARQNALLHIFQQHVLRRLRAYGVAVALDVACVFAGCELATMVRFVGRRSFEQGVLASLLPSLAIGLLYAAVAYLAGLHRRLWRYASLRDALALARVVGMAGGIALVADLVGSQVRELLPLSVVIGGMLLSLLLLGVVKLLPRLSQAQPGRAPAEGGTRVLIVGAGRAGADLAARFLVNKAEGYRVVAFLDDDPAKHAKQLHGAPVLGPISRIPAIVASATIDLIAIAVPTASAQRLSEIIALCLPTSAQVKIVQGLHEMVNGQVRSPALREVNVAELLGRDVVPLHTDLARDAIAGRVVLVTGAAGSIGSELCRQVLACEPATLLALDNNETGLFDLAQELSIQPFGSRLQVHIGDISDESSMEAFFGRWKPAIVFHAAAYKHVPLLERHPEQAVRVNVLGTYCLCRLAAQVGVEHFVFISSDKAADPVNVLGASKRAGELVVQALAAEGTGNTEFCAVRFGNVLASRGSVVPTFLKQIERGGPVTVTDPDVTRYFMTVQEACGLVIHAGLLTEESGLYLLDMGEPVRIADVANKLVRLRGLRVGRDIPIVFTGLRPGEKMHETLVSTAEALDQTSHPKIFKLREATAALSLDDLDAWARDARLDEIKSDGQALRSLLFRLVRDDQHRLIPAAAGRTRSERYA